MEYRHSSEAERAANKMKEGGIYTHQEHEHFKNLAKSLKEHENPYWNKKDQS